MSAPRLTEGLVILPMTDDEFIAYLNQPQLANATSHEIPKPAPAFCTGNNRYSCDCDYCK